MIPFSTAPTETPGWQQRLADGFRAPLDLLRYLGLEHLWRPQLERATDQFPLRVTRYFADLMKPGDPQDPLLMQVLPSLHELEPMPGFDLDPTGDRQATQAPGLLRKYRGRALVIASGSCAIHCRYCFRRHYPYREQRADRRHWQALASQLATDPELHEVILSGGDPLMLGNARLAELMASLAAVPQLKRLRLHSRLPVVLPHRIDAGLVTLLASSPLRCSLVLHVNHPAELAPRLAERLAPLRHAGVQLLNQAVLLKGINDDLDVQVDLSEKLFDFGILPYYLHQLDKVAGAAPFEVPEARAKALLEALRKRLPGYLVPRLVVERAGAASKTPLA